MEELKAAQQLELPDRTWIRVGDRVIIHPGLPSQMCGTVVDFRYLSGREGLFPVVMWDAGCASFASCEWGLRLLKNPEQLSLF